jgi:hypothetical protein
MKQFPFYAYSRSGMIYILDVVAVQLYQQNFDQLDIANRGRVLNVFEKMLVVGVNLNIDVPRFDQESEAWDISELRYIIPKNHPAKSYGVSLVLDLLSRFFEGARAQQQYVVDILGVISPQKARQGMFNNQYSYHTQMMFSDIDLASVGLPLAARQLVVLFHIAIVLTYTTEDLTDLETALYRLACALLRPYHLLLAPRRHSSTSVTKANEEHKDVSTRDSTNWHYWEHMPQERKELGAAVTAMVEGIADKACGDLKRKLGVSSGSRGSEDLENARTYLQVDREGNDLYNLSAAQSKHKTKKRQRVLQPRVLVFDPRITSLPGMAPFFTKLWSDPSHYHKISLASLEVGGVAVGSGGQLAESPSLWVVCNADDLQLFQRPNRQRGQSLSSFLVSLCEANEFVEWQCLCSVVQHEPDCCLHSAE